jgi:hypothetical protein
MLAVLLAISPAMSQAATASLTRSCNPANQSLVDVEVDDAGFARLIEAIRISSIDRTLFERLHHPESLIGLRFPEYGRNYISMSFAEAQDPQEIANAIAGDPYLRALGVRSAYASGGAVPPSLDVAGLALVEFYHPGLDHYRLIPSGVQSARYDDGGEGPGWARTGKEILALQPGTGTPVRAFRFNDGAAAGSTFYTASPADCGILRREDWGLTYQGVAFGVWAAASAGVCGFYRMPVYRVYNGRSRSGASNHRYLLDYDEYRAMVSRGWLDEGIAFCSLAYDYPWLHFH